MKREQIKAMRQEQFSFVSSEKRKPTGAESIAARPFEEPYEIFVNGQKVGDVKGITNAMSRGRTESDRDVKATVEVRRSNGESWIYDRSRGFMPAGSGHVGDFSGHPFRGNQYVGGQ